MLSIRSHTPGIVGPHPQTAVLKAESREDQKVLEQQLQRCMPNNRMIRHRAHRRGDNGLLPVGVGDGVQARLVFPPA